MGIFAPKYYRSYWHKFIQTIQLPMIPTQKHKSLSKKISNYIFHFSDFLGKGNFSHVYKGNHSTTSETVAIKIIDLHTFKSGRFFNMLSSEVKILETLNHPNILRYHQTLTSKNNCYIITELCEDGDLQTKLKKQHRFTEQQSLPLIKDIFSGLIYLSQKNIIHRDLKLANIFLHGGKAKIADFGFAKLSTSNFHDVNIGSPLYMSPQSLIEGIYGPKTDVWAFGILIYELLHGQAPFSFCENEMELRYHILIPIRKDRMRQQLSPEIKEVISQCLEVRQSERISVEKLQKMGFFKKLFESQKLAKEFMDPDFDQIRQSLSLKFEPVTPKLFQAMSFQNQQNFGLNQVHKKQKEGDCLIPMKYKQLVGLLHYCRLVYKLTVILLEIPKFKDNKALVLANWLLIWIQELKSKVESSVVVSEKKKNTGRERKLLEVVCQYEKKYIKQFRNHSKIQANLQKVIKQAYSLCEQIQSKLTKRKIENLIVIGHFALMVYNFSHILRKCQEQKSFKFFGKCRQLEEFLEKEQETLSIKTYELMRKKVMGVEKGE